MVIPGLYLTQKENKILQYLEDELIRGWETFQVEKLIRQVLSSGQIQEGKKFWETIAGACADSWVLSLYKILDRHDDVMSIYYILNIIQKNSRTRIKEKDRKPILEMIQQQKEGLEAKAGLLGMIKERRDRAVAHLDRKLVNKPVDSIGFPALINQEVEGLFEYLFDILEAYSGQSTRTRLEAIKQEIKALNFRYLDSS